MLYRFVVFAVSTGFYIKSIIETGNETRIKLAVLLPTIKVQ